MAERLVELIVVPIHEDMIDWNPPLIAKMVPVPFVWHPNHFTTPAEAGPVVLRPIESPIRRGRLWPMLGNDGTVRLVDAFGDLGPPDRPFDTIRIGPYRRQPKVSEFATS